jgi:hypothetical protein
MKCSQEIDKLATALANAQGALTAAPKQKTNPHFKSKYADLPALWEVSRDVLAANGLALVQLPRHVPENGICIETMIVHASGQWISDDGLFLPASKLDAQGYGSALTYARRYGMGAILGLVSDEDDDGNAASETRTAKPVDGKWASEVADWLAVIESAESYEMAKAGYSKGVAAARDHDDVKAAERMKAALLARKDVPARAAA